MVLEREVAYAVHGALCKELALDDLSLKYESPHVDRPADRAYAMGFERKEGRGGFKVEIDTREVKGATRLLLAYAWPPTAELVAKTADAAVSAVLRSVVKVPAFTAAPVLSEVRIRAQCSTPDGDAASFVTGRLLAMPKAWLGSFGGPPTFGSVRVRTAALAYADDPFAGAKRDLTIEVLNEDRASLYLELVSTWTQYPEMSDPASASRIDLTKPRPLDLPPSKYVLDASSFLTDRLQHLAAILGG